MNGPAPRFPEDTPGPPGPPGPPRPWFVRRWKAAFALVAPLAFVLMVGGVAYANTFMLHAGHS